MWARAESRFDWAHDLRVHMCTDHGLTIVLSQMPFFLSISFAHFCLGVLSFLYFLSISAARRLFRNLLHSEFPVKREREDVWCVCVWRTFGTFRTYYYIIEKFLFYSFALPTSEIFILLLHVLISFVWGIVCPSHRFSHCPPQWKIPYYSKKK